MKEEPKNTWEYIKIYFPDIWQYIILIVVIALAALFIL